MSLDLDNLLSNEHAIVKIVGNPGSGISIQGIITSGFTVSGSAEYNNIFESTLSSNLSKTLAGAKFTAGSLPVASKLFKVVQGVNLQSKWQTTDYWVSSAKPSFSIDTIFFTLSRKDDVRTKVNSLLRCVFPQSKEKGTLYGPPLGYTASAKIVVGTVDVTIGTWFHARRQIIKEVSASYSKEVVAPGRPLFVEVKIDFEYYRVPDADEVTSWFTYGG
jgi:hypothetical protein